MGRRSMTVVPEKVAMRPIPYKKSRPDIVVHPLGAMGDVVSTLFRLFRAATIHRGGEGIILAKLEQLVDRR